MTYKAAFFPHIRWGIWSNHYGWLPFQPVSTNQHLLRSRGRSPGLQTNHSIIGSDPNVWDFLLEPKRENFSAKIRFCSFAGSSEQNQQRRPDVQWNAGWGGGSQSQQLSATAMLCLQLGRPKRPSDAEKVQQPKFQRGRLWCVLCIKLPCTDGGQYESEWLGKDSLGKVGKQTESRGCSRELLLLP